MVVTSVAVGLQEHRLVMAHLFPADERSVGAEVRAVHTVAETLLAAQAPSVRVLRIEPTALAAIFFFIFFGFVLFHLI